MKVGGALAGAASFLGTRLDAELLLAHVLDASRAAVLARDERELTPEEHGDFERLLARRLAGEPLAYLTGEKEFWSLALNVTPDVLVPRPETELLVEWGLELLSSKPGPSVLDLGTGSGAIALALAKELPAGRVVATDISGPALDVARANATRLGLKVEFAAGDYYKALDAGFRRHDAAFDLVVSNPPYVAAGDPHLADLEFEPPLALISGADGLDAIRVIVREAPQHLERGGWLLLEHGAEQGPAVRTLMADAGFAAIETRRDLAGLERATGGQLL